MAFNDNPNIDDYSKNCEDSVLAVKMLFKQKNGFICRTVSPDFGIDEDVELNLFNEETKKYDKASNKHFSLQLKSIDKDDDKFITKNDINYIKLQFETSRLGYILRRPPAYGIVIIYDVREEKLYYDYGEEIYYRLNDLHGNDKWKNSEKPLIYIPVENILNEKAVNSIYKFMIERHKNAQLSHIANASKYNIPVFEDSIIQNEIDFKNPETIKKHLLNYGWALVDSHDFILLNSMLSQLSFSEIISSKELQLLSAVVNCEIGNFIDADYFLHKSELVDDFSTEQIDVKLFTRFKVDFALGRFDNTTYLNKLENQLKTIKSVFNELIIKINIVYLKLLMCHDKRKLDNQIINEIDYVFKQILNSKLDESKKNYLINYHSFNLNTYGIDLLIEKIGKFKIKESINIHVPISDRVSDVKEILQVLGLPTKYTLTTWEYAEKNNDEYLRANSLYHLAFYFFTLHFNLAILHDKIFPINDDLKKSYETNINYAFNAFDVFSKLSRNKDAYNALTIAYELTALFERLFGESILNKSDDVHAQIKLIERQLGFSEYHSVVIKTFDKKNKRQQETFEDFLDVDETELDFYADKIISGIGLPIERKKNVLIDMQNNRYFYKHRKSDKLELLQDSTHTQSINTYYRDKPMYIIRCVKCNFQTIRSSDVKQMLSMFEYHNC